MSMTAEIADAFCQFPNVKGNQILEINVGLPYMAAQTSPSSFGNSIVGETHLLLQHECQVPHANSSTSSSWSSVPWV